MTSMSAAASQADEFIAGIEPWQRPANAPVITVFAKDGAWYGKALTGVEQPYPASLRFLEETCPEPPLLPVDFAGRAIVRQMALLVACRRLATFEPALARDQERRRACSA